MTTTTHLLIASLARPINGASHEIQLLPASNFAAQDGRPGNIRGSNVKEWQINSAIAQRLIKQFAQKKGKIPIDYEHQTQMAAENGKDAPAAGWYTGLEWREGSGLWAVGVEWTAKAAAAIAAGEYKYISPVFAWNRQTGEIVEVLMAALTNFPAIDGMAEVALASAFSRFYQPTQPQETPMNPLLQAVLARFGCTEADALAKLTAHFTDHDALKASAADATTQLGTLRAANTNPEPDPKKWVSVESFTKLSGEFAALSARIMETDVATLVKQGQQDGKLTAAQADYATTLGQKHGVAEVSAYIAAQPVMPALLGQQTGGKVPAGAAADPVDPAQDSAVVALAALMGADVKTLFPAKDAAK